VDVVSSTGDSGVLICLAVMLVSFQGGKNRCPTGADRPAWTRRCAPRASDAERLQPLASGLRALGSQLVDEDLAA